MSRIFNKSIVYEDTVATPNLNIVSDIACSFLTSHGYHRVGFTDTYGKGDGFILPYQAISLKIAQNGTTHIEAWYEYIFPTIIAGRTRKLQRMAYMLSSALSKCN